jgi:hypothetical protein
LIALQFEQSNSGKLTGVYYFGQGMAQRLLNLSLIEFREDYSRSTPSEDKRVSAIQLLRQQAKGKAISFSDKKTTATTYSGDARKKYLNSRQLYSLYFGNDDRETSF